MNPPILGFLHQSTTRPVYVVGGDVFVFAPSRHSPSMVSRRIASLAAEARASIDRVVWPQEDSLPDSMRLRDHLQHVGEFRFCIGRLIPHLRCLVQKQAEPTCSADTRQMLERLAELAKRMTPLADPGWGDSPITAEMLGDILRAPCEIFQDRVTPLEPATSLAPSGHVVSVNGRAFVRRTERARPLSQVVRTIEQFIRLRMTAAPTGRFGALAREFLAIISEIIDRHRPVRHERYLELYRDRFHRLQMRRGCFVLVRGPVRHRTANRRIFVALRIDGAVRHRLLSATPAAGVSPDAFWTPGGMPVQSGMCVGARKQFARLHSERFSDAEAVVNWLDAGVVIASGRSLLHRQLRGRAAPTPRPRRRALIRRRV